MSKQDYNFNKLVLIEKVSACSTCATFHYKMNVNLTKKIEFHLSPFGELSYNLDKCQIVRIENDIISLNQARLNSNTFKVKFKTNKEEYKKLFDIQLASFIEDEYGYKISME